MNLKKNFVKIILGFFKPQKKKNRDVKKGGKSVSKNLFFHFTLTHLEVFFKFFRGPPLSFNFPQFQRGKKRISKGKKN